MQKSKMLFICYFDKQLKMSRFINAYVFKFGDEYQKFHNDILYFCNWANQSIEIKSGWNIYHSIQ
jgi:hypothetical protein